MAELTSRRKAVGRRERNNLSGLLFAAPYALIFLVFILIPVILFVGWLSLYMSPYMENWFFGGDMRMWISHDLGITYD